MGQAMVNISADVAIALGMKHEALFGEGAFDMPYRDEFEGGWFWFDETFEEPKRTRCVTVIRLHDDDDDCA
jgi:hypothetical protein